MHGKQCEEETYPIISPSLNAKILRIHTASLQPGQPGGGIWRSRIPDFNPAQVDGKVTGNQTGKSMR
jgi:hypothetical protein